MFLTQAHAALRRHVQATLSLAPNQANGPMRWTSWPSHATSRGRMLSRLALLATIAIFFFFSSPWLATRHHLPVTTSQGYGTSSETPLPDFAVHHITEADGPNAALSATRMPYIPPKIWQIYLDWSPQMASHAVSWIGKSPSYMYTVLDADGALQAVRKLSAMPGRDKAMSLYLSMSRRVLRGDFLRYLLLAIEGGVYSDMDTTLTRPVRDWVPDKFKPHAKLVVGLEADQSPPVDGTSFEVQFCQWTLAGQAGHPALWSMVDRILDRVAARVSKSRTAGTGFTNDDVLHITGPAGWSEIVYAHISAQAGKTITWSDLTGMKEPRLYGDTVVLPIDGFATGVPHSNASHENTEMTMIRHAFVGAWKDGEH